MKKILLILVLLVAFTGCGSSTLVDVKYRDDDVDVGDSRFEDLDTSKSSWIEGAWYDDDNQYMIMNLDGTYYQYCEVPESVWSKYKKAESFGSDYNAYIKGDYDCRFGVISPSY